MPTTKQTKIIKPAELMRVGESGYAEDGVFLLDEDGDKYVCFKSRVSSLKTDYYQIGVKRYGVGLGEFESTTNIKELRV